MKKLILIALIFSLLLSSCARQTLENAPKNGVGTIVKTAKGQYIDISVSELNKMLKNKDFVFVNVHIPFEGNIPNTDLSIPYDTIDQHLNQLPAEKNAKIVLYCRSDRMSNIAANTLVEKGYTNVYNLDGGFTEWEKAGLPIEK